jgi:hypothetical protein
MSIRKNEMARIMANAMIQKWRTRDEIVAALETEFGEDVAVMQRGDHEELWFVYDDCTPSVKLVDLPKLTQKA